MKFAAAIIATVAANRYENMNEDDLLVNSSPPFHLPSPARPEVMPMPPSPRPLPSRTSRRSSMSEAWARNEQHPQADNTNESNAQRIGLNPQWPSLTKSHQQCNYTCVSKRKISLRTQMP